MTNEEWINTFINKFNESKDYKITDVRDREKLLDELRPTGKWIDDKCSICGKGIEDLIDSREWYRNETPNYCPFCGVRIEEAENEQTN